MVGQVTPAVDCNGRSKVTGDSRRLLEVVLVLPYTAAGCCGADCVMPQNISKLFFIVFDKRFD
jgi:hypothetical protein